MSAPDPAEQVAVPPEPDLLRVHRRAMRVLVAGQVAGGIGVGSAASVGGLIAEQLGGSPGWAGTAITMFTLGAAVFAIPLAGVAARRGRRIGLSLGLSTALLGAVVAIAMAALGSFVGYLVGMLMFGSGSATNLQMRFAATDLAPERTRGRDLSIVVWATTLGAVAGPNLTAPGAAVARAFGLPELAGPFVFSAVAFGIGMAIVVGFLRPDPLLLAQRRAAGARNGLGAEVASPMTRDPDDSSSVAGTERSAPAVAMPLRQVAGIVVRRPAALFAYAAIALSHAVMVSVMAMAPVHLKGETHAELTIVGLAISLHIAGMYALSPLVGWLADRLGRLAVTLAGQAFLLAAVTVGALGQASHTGVTVGLVLLGLGWSCALVGGTTLLAESLDPRTRVRAAGLSDLTMNLAGASGGALAGVVLALVGYAGLNIAAGVLTLPVLFLGLSYASRRRQLAATQDRL